MDRNSLGAVYKVNARVVGDQGEGFEMLVETKELASIIAAGIINDAYVILSSSGRELQSKIDAGNPERLEVIIHDAETLKNYSTITVTPATQEELDRIVNIVTMDDYVNVPLEMPAGTTLH